MTSSSRSLSLRDYLRVLRDHRVLIVVMTAVFAVVANRISNQLAPSYHAESSVALTTLSEDQTLAGLPAVGAIDQPPYQTPAINAETITSPAIINPAVAELRHRFPSVTATGLRGSLSARVEAQSNLIILDVSSTRPRLAQAAVNVVARRDVTYVDQLEHDRFSAAAASLRGELAAIPNSTTNQAERSVYVGQIARLRSLTKFAQGAQVTQLSRLPTSPTSPNPVRDSILAGLVGLTLAIIVSFLRSSLDRRVRSASEIQRELGVTLVGRVAASAMGRSVTAKKARKRMTAQDFEAFRILNENLNSLSQDRKLVSVAVTSSLSEEGKSTVASSLAFASYCAGRRTLLIEADLRRPSLAARAGLQASPGLHELLTGSASLEQAVQTTLVVPFSQNGDHPTDELPDVNSLDVITSGSRLDTPAELLGGAAFGALVAEVSKRYDAVVIDTAPLLPVADTLKVLPQVDAVLICVRVGRSRSDELRSTREALELLPQRPVGLVVTGVRRGEESDYGYYPPTRPARA